MYLFSLFSLFFVYFRNKQKIQNITKTKRKKSLKATEHGIGVSSIAIADKKVVVFVVVVVFVWHCSYCWVGAVENGSLDKGVVCSRACE